MEHPELHHPHDLLVRRFFPDPELMADFLQRYPQNPTDQQRIALLDLTKLVCKDPVTVTDKLAEIRGDLRFSTLFKGSDCEANVYLFFEHQSTKDADLRVRGLEHIIEEYKKFRTTTKGRKKFPYPIFVVLHHGKTPWEHVPEMDELIEIVPGMQTGLLQYMMIFIDISPLTQDQFGGHPVLAVALEMLQLAPKNELAKHLDRVLERLKAVNTDPRIYSWLLSFAQYVLATTTLDKEQVATTISQVTTNKKETYNMVMTTAEKLFYEGEARGEARGEAKAGRNMVLKALHTKFRQVPKPIEQAVLAMSDPIALESLLEHVFYSETIDEFATALQ